MKRKLSLTVSEFQQMVDLMSAQVEAELTATRARMEALRSDQLPPG